MVKKWFGDANVDLLTAKMTFEAGKKFYNQSAFNCQQCVEKSIKGFLVSQRKSFGKTHDLVELKSLAISISSEIKSLDFSLGKMTRYAVAYRYPDARSEELTKSDIKEAIKNAETVFNEFSLLVNSSEND